MGYLEYCLALRLVCPIESALFEPGVWGTIIPDRVGHENREVQISVVEPQGLIINAHRGLLIKFHLSAT